MWLQLAFLLFLIALFSRFIFFLKPKIRLNEDYLEILKEMAEKNMYANEIPVSAILVYKNEIIGMGKNSMVSEGKISGHAELNALNDAFSKLGNEFYKLNKNELALYTTFEPCPMCKGALIQHEITNVFFDLPKDSKTWFRIRIFSLLFNIKQNRFKSKNLQKSLFQKHPSYRKHHNLN